MKKETKITFERGDCKQTVIWTDDYLGRLKFMDTWILNKVTWILDDLRERTETN